MLQSTVSVKDAPSLVTCINWVNSNAGENSVVVAHYALYDLFRIYGNSSSILAVRRDAYMWGHIQNETTLADGLIEAADNASAGGNSVYTVWWVSGKGWYGLPSLPSAFREVYPVGDMAVYLYHPET